MRNRNLKKSLKIHQISLEIIGKHSIGDDLVTNGNTIDFLGQICEQSKKV